MGSRSTRSGGFRAGVGNSHRGGHHRGEALKPALQPVYSSKQLTEHVATMGNKISKDYGDRTLDVVVMLDSAFVFAADLIRRISCPVVCHFVWAEIRDVQFAGHDRREIYFSRPPRLEKRDVLVVDAVVQ